MTRKKERARKTDKPAPRKESNAATVAWWTPDDVQISPYIGIEYAIRGQAFSATVIAPTSVEDVDDIVRQAGGSVDG